MYLGKRSNGIYFIKFFDSEKNRTRRVSTEKKLKQVIEQTVEDEVLCR